MKHIAVIKGTTWGLKSNTSHSPIKSSVRWDAASSGWDTDGIAHCCKGTGEGNGYHACAMVVDIRDHTDTGLWVCDGSTQIHMEMKKFF